MLPQRRSPGGPRPRGPLPGRTHGSGSYDRSCQVRSPALAPDGSGAVVTVAGGEDGCDDDDQSDEQNDNHAAHLLADLHVRVRGVARYMEHGMVRRKVRRMVHPRAASGAPSSGTW